MLNHIRSLNPALGLAGVLLLVGVIYFPALDSLFLLDDVQNLNNLSEIDSRGLGFYLFGGNAGPGGRPISLLSFAMQYQDWPANPFAFKLVNLLLHLVNGGLIYYICTLIVPVLKLPASGRKIFSLLVVALWLLHPIQLSTVLYVVQRMSILATMFVLSGIVIYLTGRRLYLNGKLGSGMSLTLSGVYLCMLLAVLSKEIGILLPLYVLVLEFTLLSDGQLEKRWRKIIVPFLILPLLLVLLYLFRDPAGFLAAYQIRDYTVGQRLMTEANVLMEYLKLIFIPVSGAFSIFHDDHIIAKSLYSPPVTIISILIIFLMISISFYLRKKTKLVSFAIFWFFAGHALESSIISLELYFEHRNYLPSLGIIMLVCWGLIGVSQRVQSGLLRSAILPAYLLPVFLVTLMELSVWSNPYLQANEWARQHPQSKRALNNLLNINLILGNKQDAVIMMEKLQGLDSHDIYPTIKLITIRSCFDRERVPDSDWVNYNNLAAIAEFRGASVLSELEYLVYQSTHNYCEGLDIDKLTGFIDILINNKEFVLLRGELHEIATTFAVIQGDLDSALARINSSIRVSSNIDRRIYKLKILVARQETAESVKLLHDIKMQLQKMPKAFLFYRDTIDSLEKQLSTAENSAL